VKLGLSEINSTVQLQYVCLSYKTVVFTLKFFVFCLFECSFDQNDCVTPYKILNDAPGRCNAQFENHCIKGLSFVAFLCYDNEGFKKMISQLKAACFTVKIEN